MKHMGFVKTQTHFDLAECFELYKEHKATQTENTLCLHNMRFTPFAPVTDKPTTPAKRLSKLKQYSVQLCHRGVFTTYTVHAPDRTTARNHAVTYHARRIANAKTEVQS